MRAVMSINTLVLKSGVCDDFGDDHAPESRYCACRLRSAPIVWGNRRCVAPSDRYPDKKRQTVVCRESLILATLSLLCNYCAFDGQVGAGMVLSMPAFMWGWPRVAFTCHGGGSGCCGTMARAVGQSSGPCPAGTVWVSPVPRWRRRTSG